jgi:hypothetical protein
MSCITVLELVSNADTVLEHCSGVWLKVEALMSPCEREVMMLQVVYDVLAMTGENE